MSDRREEIRVAVSPISGLVLATGRAGAEIPIHIARDHQVEPAVTIVIHETCTHRPAAGSHAGNPGYIRERAISSVVVQNTTAQVGDVEVREAVVVIVPGGHAHAVGMALNSGPFGHVGESAVAIVSV